MLNLFQIPLIVNKHQIDAPIENMENDESVSIGANVDRMNAPFWTFAF